MPAAHAKERGRRRRLRLGLPPPAAGQVGGGQARACKGRRPRPTRSVASMLRILAARVEAGNGRGGRHLRAPSVLVMKLTGSTATAAYGGAGLLDTAAADMRRGHGGERVQAPWDAQSGDAVHEKALVKKPVSMRTRGLYAAAVASVALPLEGEGGKRVKGGQDRHACLPSSGTSHPHCPPRPARSRDGRWRRTGLFSEPVLGTGVVWTGREACGGGDDDVRVIGLQGGLTST